MSSRTIQQWPRVWIHRLWIVCMVLCFGLQAQEDAAVIDTFFDMVGFFDWDADIDSQIRLLKELPIDTCVTLYRNNPITVGPSVNCALSNSSLGMGYHWGDDGEPILAFFSIHFADCETCSETFAHLTSLGYTERKNAEPIEVDILSRYFRKDGKDSVRIDVWNECCPGDRIKIFRVVQSPPRQ